MALLGTDTYNAGLAAAQSNLGADNVVFFQYTATGSFTAGKVFVYMAGFAGTIPATFGIYADNAGAVGARLGDTAEVSVTTTPGFVEGTLDAGVSVVNGTTYWLAVGWGSGGADIYYENDGVSVAHYVGSAYASGTLPASPSASLLFSGKKFYAYADVGGGGGGGTTVTPTTLALTTATFAPTVAVTGNQTVTPTTLALTLATFAPTVTASGSQTVTPTTAALALTTYAPTVSATSSGGGSHPFRSSLISGII